MNKRNIKVFFFFLSLYMCASNKAFANEPSLVNFTPKKDIPTKDIPTKDIPTKDIPTKDIPTNNPVQTDKKINKSVLVRLAQRMSAILIVILRAFACKQSKPQKSGLDKHIRTKNIAENATLGKATTDSVNPDNDDKNDIISISDSFDEMYENNKYLLCNDPEETKKVTKYMNEAVTLLQKQIETTVGYQNHFNYNNADIYTKKQDDADIGKLNITIENPDKYDEIKNMLWDPNNPQNIDHKFLNGQVVRVYNPNLMMIQQCYVSASNSSVICFHYLFKRVEISKDTTIIVYISTNMSDVNNNIEKNIHTLLEIVYSLKLGCNFEEELKNKFVNLSGYTIKKKDTHVDVTYFNSIFDSHILARLYDFKRIRSKNYVLLMNLKGIFSQKNKCIPNSTFLLS